MRNLKLGEVPCHAWGHLADKQQNPDPHGAASAWQASRFTATALEAKQRDSARTLLAARSPCVLDRDVIGLKGCWKKRYGKTWCRGGDGSRGASWEPPQWGRWMKRGQASVSQPFLTCRPSPIPLLFGKITIFFYDINDFKNIDCDKTISK